MNLKKIYLICVALVLNLFMVCQALALPVQSVTRTEISPAGISSSVDVETAIIDKVRIVELGSKFGISKNEAVIVGDYQNLEIKSLGVSITKPEINCLNPGSCEDIPASTVIQLMLSLPQGETATGRQMYIQLGKSDDFADVKISFLDYDENSQIATLLVVKDDNEDDVMDVKLGDKFELGFQEKARIVDFRNAILKIEGRTQIACICADSVPCKCPEWGGLGISLEIPSSESSTSTYFYLNAGEEKSVAGLTVRLIEVKTSSAVLLIKSNSETEYVIAYLNQQFTLKSQQTAKIMDYKDLKIKLLGETACECPVTSPDSNVACKCNPGVTIRYAINPFKNEAVQVPATIYKPEETDSRPPKSEKVTPIVPIPAPEQELTLSLGERKQIFGATIYLVALKDGAATFLVTAAYDQNRMPVCVSIGTQDEGWSFKGKYVKQEACSSCKPVCKEVGTDQEGWYSSCSSSLIVLDNCDSEKSTKEIVTCVFDGAVQNSQTCYSDAGKCTSGQIDCICGESDPKCACPVKTQSSCSVEVIGKQGTRLTWKSTCGGYAYTVFDGEDEKAVFDCSAKSVPACAKVGTSEEGWYLDGRLIAYDRCACQAVCKKKGPMAEGYYNSCNGNLIMQSKCTTDDSIKVTKDDGRDILITVNSQGKSASSGSGGAVEIKSVETATTNEQLVVDGNKLALKTSQGEKVLKYLPEDAKAVAVGSAKMSKIDGIELKVEGEVPYYEVSGDVKSTWLWIFPSTKKSTVKVNAETNQLITG